jgi:hypothetical protein
MFRGVVLVNQMFRGVVLVNQMFCGVVLVYQMFRGVVLVNQMFSGVVLVYQMFSCVVLVHQMFTDVVLLSQILCVLWSRLAEIRGRRQLLTSELLNLKEKSKREADQEVNRKRDLQQSSVSQNRRDHMNSLTGCETRWLD